jgi:uncharacterized protein (TIGR00661 family)
VFFPLPLFNLEKNRLEIKNSNAWETIHRYYDLRANIRDIAPHLIISDGDINALRLAQHWRFPSVYIANMIRPSRGFSAFLNPGERLVERYVKRCSRIIIPDNPPPYTISEYSIGNVDDMGLNGKVEFVGSFVDTTPVEGSKQHIFAPLSGPPGTRAKMLKMLLPVLEEIKTKCIISLGAPSKKVTAKVENCELHTWLSAEERAECMRNAKFVIFSGGHATCFETVKYAKPSICMPTQAEQLGNAAKLQDLNCSITVKNKKQLKEAVERIENEQESFYRNVLALNEFSNKFKGLDRAQTIVETLQD